MRLLTRISVIAVVLAAITVSTLPAWAADDSASLSDAQVQQIRQNCTQAQSILQRLQSTDVATRINRGRIYDNLLSNLITPFDNRVALNNYDASTLTVTANSIDQKFTAFKSDYSTYEDSFSKLLTIKCQANPKVFYEQLVDTRDYRTQVADDITDLNTLISQYTASFNQLKATVGNN